MEATIYPRYAIIILSNPTNDSSHCDVSCMCELLPGCGAFESWASGMNRSARGQPYGDLMTSRSTTWHHVVANTDSAVPSTTRKIVIGCALSKAVQEALSEAVHLELLSDHISIAVHNLNHYC
jgi:hypothetical protein